MTFGLKNDNKTTLVLIKEIFLLNVSLKIKKTEKKHTR